MGTLQARLFLTYLFVIVVTLGLATLSLFLLLGGYRDSVTYGNLETLGPFVRTQLGITAPEVEENHDPTGTVPLEAEVLLNILGVSGDGERERLRTVTSLAVVNQQGQVLPQAWAGPNSLMGAATADLPPSEAAEGAGDISPRRCQLNTEAGTTLLCVAMPLGDLDLEGIYGEDAAALVVATPAASTSEVIADLTPRLAISGVMGVAAALVLGFFFSQSVAAPLRNIARAARSVARGNYRQRVPATGPREVRDLAANFNRMTGEVQSSQQTLRDFLANISHELKTPLTSIRGFSEAVLDGTIDDEEGIRRSARIINDESGRVLRLVEELLDLSRIESGQVPMRKEPMELDELFEHLSVLFGLRSEESGVRLEISNTSSGRVIGDFDRLEQVLNNLLDNAFRHTPGGGLIRLAARDVHEGAIQVTVSDSGSGIPEEDIPHLFDRFYRAKSTGNGAARSGYGLGLSISREIVRAHGGEIWATSESGQGTTFVFTLPTAAQTAPTAAAQ
ncbi:MAG: HAMP domain-containing sensor histidine kinase [Dehalococcoidia bacterium]|nr:HAMP domain-containing sensor histidine kinase [Dehalococcoidia bacterium]